MVAGLLLLVTLTMKLFPRVPLSRALHRLLVEMPLAALVTLRRRHVIFVLIVAAMLFAGAELIMMVGAPEIAVVLAWDVSFYVDALLAAWALAAAGTMARPLRGARRRAPRRRRPASKVAANDSDEDPGGVLSFARA